MALLMVVTMLKNDKLCNRYYVYALMLTLILTCSIPVYADTSDDSNSSSSGSDSVYNDYYTDVSVSPIIQTLPEGELLEVKSTTNRVSASDATGLKSLMLTLIGDYDTVVTDYTYQSSSGYTTHSIQIERDWSWIISAVLFVVVIYCTIRGIVAILCRA